MDTQRRSSTLSSLPGPFNFARGNPRNCYISIIDTQDLEDNSAIVHVPSLEFLTGDRDFDHEYLAHGVITGPALKAVPFQAFQDAGLMPPYPYKISMHLGDTSIAPSTTTETNAARKVADLYGDKFAAAVFVAILTLKQRSPDFWRSDKELEKALPFFVEAMKTCSIPGELCGDACILTVIVYTTGYESVEQMIKMLRALVNWRHEKGARGRAKGLCRELM